MEMNVQTYACILRHSGQYKNKQRTLEFLAEVKIDQKRKFPDIRFYILVILIRANLGKFFFKYFFHIQFFCELFFSILIFFSVNPALVILILNQSITFNQTLPGKN